MSTESRFRPPTAVVVDNAAIEGPSDGLRLALAIATLLHLMWFFILPLRACFRLVEMGAASPIGLVALLAAMACLYLGVLRLVGARRRGARLLLASVVLQSFAAASWHAFLFGAWRGYGLAMFAMPLVFGFALAVWAWLVARPLAGSSVARSLTTGDAS